MPRRPAPSASIRLLVADDHHLVRQGFAAMLGRVPGLRIVAEAADGHEAVRLFAEHRPDVALIDLRMPGLDGAGAVEAILGQFPDARLVLLTTFGGEEDIYRGLRAGAFGYLLKDVRLDGLVDTIRRVHAGETVLPPALAAKLAARVRAPALSERELDVLRLLTTGRSNKEIGAGLGIAEATVKTHVSRVLRKLGAASRTGAAAAAARRGIL